MGMKFKVLVEYEYPTEHKLPVKAELVLHGDRVVTDNIKWIEQEPTTKNDKVDCKHTDCNNCVNHKYCDYESTTKNDLGVVIDAMEYRTNALIENIKSEILHFANAHCSGDDINIYDVFKVIDDCCESSSSEIPNKSEIPTGSTTKNDLGVDCISRVKVIDYLCKHCPDDGECFEDCDEIKHLRQMPPVIPQESKILALLEKTYADLCNCEGGEGWLKIDGKEYSTDAGYALEGMSIFMEVFRQRLVKSEETETWNGIHAQITAPKGTFDKIFNDANDDNNI